MTTSTAPLVASIDETAELLGISRSSVYKLLDSGELRFVRLGSRRVVPRSAIVELVERSA